MAKLISAFAVSTDSSSELAKEAGPCYCGAQGSFLRHFFSLELDFQDLAIRKLGLAESAGIRSDSNGRDLAGGLSNAGQAGHGPGLRRYHGDRLGCLES